MPSGKEIADIVEQLVFKTETVTFPLIGDGFVLNRHPYGQRLLKLAENNGVEIRSETKAIKAIVDPEGVKGAVLKQKGSG
ncbi:MAG: hypothetical protein ACW99F_10270, partial [Candidatus Hodarchaeales archaeon]